MKHNRPPLRQSLPVPVTPQRRWWHEIPMGTFYVPIGIAVLGMLIRYKSFRAPLKANWDLAKGGLFPESKTGFVKRFPQDHPLLPSEILLEGTLTLHEATTLFEGFFNGLHQAQPVVLKPDDGIQGRSVYFINVIAI